MKLFIVRLLLLITALPLAPAIGNSAPAADSRRNQENKSSFATTSVNQNDDISYTYTMQRLQDTRDSLKYNDDMNPEESFGESRDHITNEDNIKSNNRKTPEIKTNFLIKAIPGDGLIRLSWKLVNLPAKLDPQMLRFSIRYGIESEKFSKTLQIGTNDNHVIRDLRNYQPYFIQVIASDSEQRTTLKSNEIRVIPIPAEDQGSRLEKAFSKKTPTLLEKSEPELFERDLRQFGYDFFKNSSQLAGNSDSIPVGNDYILGPGDTLDITLWGAVNSRLELPVDRNGEVTVPKVGNVKVWGLSFLQARDSINKAIARYYKNYEMNMTLGKLRTIQVFVVGEVEAPGSYPISSMSTVINALAAAGGPTRNGSLRSVRITRTGQKPIEVDMYDMFLTGDRSKDIRLQGGDTVFVPVIGPVAAVAGEVRRPAIYEIKGATTLPEVLKMAGGVSATGYTGRIQVERVDDNRSRVILDFGTKDGSLDSSLGVVQIMDRDMIKVFPVQEAVRQIVSLKGNIVRPGEYQFRKGMRLTDLISGYQALLPETYLDSIEITRLAPPDFHRELLTTNLRRAIEGSEADNILLKEQDSIKVFSRWEMEEKPRVSVNGAVLNPGTYDYFPGMTVRDLITAAGSPKRNAFLEIGELSRIDIVGDKATPSRMPLDLSKALSGDKQHNLELKADDVLIVRGVTDWFDASDKFIKLRGEVRFPGVYSIARGEKLSSVISRAGGYTERAYLRGAKFLRRSVRETQQKRMTEVLVKAEKEILQKQAALSSVAASREELDATKASLEALLKNLEQMKEMKAEGRVVINLKTIEELRKSNFDLVVDGGDELDIPSRPSVVNVFGQVFNPVSLVYQPESADVGNCLRQAGGATKDAETSEMYIIKADGTVFSRQQSSFGLHWSDESKRWSFGSFMATLLEPGDSLVVPQKIEHIAWLREIKDITTIMSQIALTAGTVLIGLR